MLSSQNAYYSFNGSKTEVPSPVISSCSQVVAEWEMFLLNSVAYSLPVRRTARTKLEAIKAHDAAYLSELHNSVGGDLMSMSFEPTPTALPSVPLHLKKDERMNHTVGYLSFGSIEKILWFFGDLRAREKDWCSRTCGAQVT